KKKLSLVKMAFNQGQFAISVGTAGLVYERFAISSLDWSPMFFAALLATVFTFFVLNTLQIAFVIALSEGVPVRAVLVGNMKWAVPNFLALTPMGILLALVYQYFGVLGIVLLVIPLLIARSSFQAYVDMREMYLDTIKSLTAAVDAKDPYTAGHSQRVGCYAKEIAKEFKFSPEKLETLEYMAVLHDIGKLGIPEGILNKPGRLTAEEYWMMQQHSVIGYEIVGQIRRLKKDAVFIRHHHEWWDGSGYPDHLQGEEIPLESRILAVADAFDAMTMDRPYRRARTFEEALAEVKAGAGTQFDPKVVEKFLQAAPRLKEICLQGGKSREDGPFRQYLLAEAAAVREELWEEGGS
ncbi:MAG: HD-GYP domain-containing protein, partial [Clostridia bacterium]|nr:HD-GYP domain-containing protein [Clostridia bacterium]